jgi:hypothetical protein
LVGTLLYIGAILKVNGFHYEKRIEAESRRWARGERELSFVEDVFRSSASPLNHTNRTQITLMLTQATEKYWNRLPRVGPLLWRRDNFSLIVRQSSPV